jgi:hypothetical protein
MQRTELEEKIHDYIKTLYNATFNGHLKITQEGTSYTLELGVPSYMVLTTISCDADSDSDFLLFIKEELRTRNYMRKETYKVIRTNESRKE